MYASSTRPFAATPSAREASTAAPSDHRGARVARASPAPRSAAAANHHPRAGPHPASVLATGAWMASHPGGSTIIPQHPSSPPARCRARGPAFHRADAASRGAYCPPSTGTLRSVRAPRPTGVGQPTTQLRSRRPCARDCLAARKPLRHLGSNPKRGKNAAGVLEQACFPHPSPPPGGNVPSHRTRSCRVRRH